jgi:hypothetical protein
MIQGAKETIVRSPARGFGPTSIAALSCPKCGRPRCVPNGCTEPRCIVCEPEQLWLDAAEAWENTPPDQRW